jgi:subtilisin family serine protease
MRALTTSEGWRSRTRCLQSVCGMALARTATAAAVAGLVAVSVAAWSHPVHANGPRTLASVQALASPASSTWQDNATGLERVPLPILANASTITVAIIDTGVDKTSAALSGRQIVAYSVTGKPRNSADRNGHGTFIAALVARYAGNARIMVVKAASDNGTVTTAAEARAIRYAVDHGAKILNLSFAGSTTSPAERSAIAYAIGKGALLVTAAGNEYAAGNPVEYPAALVQPLGSNGRGGAGLAVGASTADGGRAPFSNAGSWISLVAPGVGVYSAVSPFASSTMFLRDASAPGYGYASGTSYAAPQVAGAAALVWSVAPSLTAREVADILKTTASGRGTWSDDVGYGVLDIPDAVALAATRA